MNNHNYMIQQLKQEIEELQKRIERLESGSMDIDKLTVFDFEKVLASHGISVLAQEEILGLEDRLRYILVDYYVGFVFYSELCNSEGMFNDMARNHHFEEANSFFEEDEAFTAGIRCTDPADALLSDDFLVDDLMVRTSLDQKMVEIILTQYATLFDNTFIKRDEK